MHAGWGMAAVAVLMDSTTHHAWAHELREPAAMKPMCAAAAAAAVRPPPTWHRINTRGTSSRTWRASCSRCSSSSKAPEATGRGPPPGGRGPPVPKGTRRREAGPVQVRWHSGRGGRRGARGYRHRAFLNREGQPLASGSTKKRGSAADLVVNTGWLRPAPLLLATSMSVAAYRQCRCRCRCRFAHRAAAAASSSSACRAGGQRGHVQGWRVEAWELMSRAAQQAGSYSYEFFCVCMWGGGRGRGPTGGRAGMGEGGFSESIRGGAG